LLADGCSRRGRARSPTRTGPVEHNRLPGKIAWLRPGRALGEASFMCLEQ
jgi:hypothetical protein